MSDHRLIRRLISAPDLYPSHSSDERLPSSDAAGSGADTIFVTRRTKLAQRGGYRHGKRRDETALSSRPSHIESRVAILERTVDRLLRLVGSLLARESERVDVEIAEIGAALKRYNEQKAALSLSRPASNSEAK